MPTRFTDELDESEFDVEKWLTESLPRGFGICIAFRDSGRITREKILKTLEENARTAGDYHKTELDKVVHELEKLRFLQKEQWRNELRKFNATEFEYADEQNIERKKIREGHIQARMTLINLLSNNEISEITRDIVQFGLDQLHAARKAGDEERYIAEIYAYADIEDFKKKILEDAQWDVNYHKKEIVENKKNETERLEMYKQVLKDVEEFFGPSQETETVKRNSERKLTKKERLIAYQVLGALIAKGLSINDVEIKNDNGDMKRILEWIGHKNVLEIAKVFKLEWLRVLKLIRDLLVELPR